MERLDISLSLAFARDKAHMRTLYCFANCSSIVSVVFVGEKVGLDESGMDTSDGMTAGLDHPSPVSGSAASFQTDQAFGRFAK